MRLNKTLSLLAFATPLLVNTVVAQAQTTGTLDKVKASGTITLAYRESSVPLSYLEAAGKPIGMAVDISKAVAEACPSGIDGYFENVGGMVLDAVLPLMNAFGRIAVCGMIAGYDGQPLPLSYPALILTQRLKVQGFIVSEHMEVWPEALTELGTLVGTGKLRPRESVAQGIAAAPEAFLGLLKGKNFGKQLVKLI